MSATLAAPAAILLLAFFAWPLTEALILSLRGGMERIETLVSPPILNDFWFSVWTSLAVALVAVAIGAGVTIAMHTAHRAVKAVTAFAMMMPLLVPHIIAAYAVRLALAPAGPLLSILVGPDAPNILVSPAALIIALVWKLLPYAYLSAQAARSAIAPELIEAARDLGSSATRRIRQILLPLMSPGLVAGGSLVFILAAAQYSITLVVYAEKKVTTIPMNVFYLDQADRPGVAAALGLAFAVFVVGASLLGERLNKRMSAHV